ncbi:MAG: helix-turn-helix domain-containing protein [Lachnospiraceae bacterium]|nr:helix-turn-helix domain-containing protein [Lachnospiraceae bacterium]
MVRSRSYIATPPGATIKEQLNDRGMSQKEFAVRMDMSEKHISKLVNGEVQLTPEVSIRLEVVLGVPAKFWNNLEAIYREKLIKAEAENAMEADEVLAKQLPYNEMAKFGWVPETRDVKEKVVYLRKYFEVVELSLLENIQITKIACRRLAVTEKSDLALLAWVQEAKRKAREMETSPINIKGLIGILPEMRRMTVKSPNDFCPELRRQLSKCGIALVFLPHLKGSFLQGASFVDGNRIVVGLTTREKGADKFWFSLFHELAHIVLGHIGQTGGTTEDDEKCADCWARDMLIPPDKFTTFKQQDIFTRDSIITFSKMIEIAPGIIVGRLQNEGYLKHNMMNDLKEHYNFTV